MGSTPNPTNFSNSNGTGTVQSDGFISTGKAPNVSAGYSVQVPQAITAAGATQGAATQMTQSVVVLAVVTASARGAKLPTAVTGLRVEVYNNTAQGCKIYPFLSDKFATAATNAAVVLAAHKANIYRAVDAKTWAVLTGA